VASWQQNCEYDRLTTERRHPAQTKISDCRVDNWLAERRI